MTEVEVKLTINGRMHRRRIEPRLLLSDFIRHEIGLTGTHVGCENGVCGACTLLLDGLATRSCCTLAVQADGRSVETVESLGRVTT
jgi:aerobic carbon-monoxide dehydrogenase small subunit